jgi:hypothetical protein
MKHAAATKPYLNMDPLQCSIINVAGRRYRVQGSLDSRDSRSRHNNKTAAYEDEEEGEDFGDAAYEPDQQGLNVAEDELLPDAVIKQVGSLSNAPR